MATLRSIRQAIGFNVPGQQPSAMQLYMTTAESPNAHTLISTLLEGDSGSHRGKYVVVNEPDTERTLSGLLRRVDEFDNETGELTLVGDLPFTSLADTEFELWESVHSPQTIHSLINQAIDHANKRTYDPVIETQLYLGPNDRRMKVPDEFYYLTEVQSLRSIDHRVVGEGGWPDTAPQDTEGLRVRVWQLPANTAVNVEITEINLARYTHLAVVAYNYGDAAALGMNVSSGATKRVECPGKGWKYLSTELEGVADETEVTLNAELVAGGTQARPLGVRFLMFVDEDSAEWADTRFNADNGLREVDIVLPQMEGESIYSGLYRSGYTDGRRIRMLGGKQLVPLTKDLQEATISAEYIINEATALDLMVLGREQPDTELAPPWFQRARLSFLDLPAYKRKRVR